MWEHLIVAQQGGVAADLGVVKSEVVLAELGWVGLLLAAEDDDGGAIQDADGVRTSRAVVIVTVAAWSLRRRGPARAREVRRRHGGARLRARKDPAAA
jgi:hypothetical protein